MRLVEGHRRVEIDETRVIESGVLTKIRVDLHITVTVVPSSLDSPDHLFERSTDVSFRESEIAREPMWSRTTDMPRPLFPDVDREIVRSPVSDLLSVDHQRDYALTTLKIYTERPPVV